MNLDNKLKFLKTHHINCTIDGYSFTDKKNTAATIYIVRDPRNFVNSISNHFSKNQTEAKEFLLRSNILGASKNNILPSDVATILGSWKEHYHYWTKKNDNLLLIKYEDIVVNPKIELKKIIQFLINFTKVQTNDAKEKNIINSTSFDSLRKMEENGKFTENVFDKIRIFLSQIGALWYLKGQGDYEEGPVNDDYYKALISNTKRKKLPSCWSTIRWPKTTSCTRKSAYD